MGKSRKPGLRRRQWLREIQRLPNATQIIAKLYSRPAMPRWELLAYTARCMAGAGDKNILTAILARGFDEFVRQARVKLSAAAGIGVVWTMEEMRYIFKYVELAESGAVALPGPQPESEDPLRPRKIRVESAKHGLKEFIVPRQTVYGDKTIH